MFNHTPGAPLVRASVAAIIGAAGLVGFASQVVAAEADEEEELAEVRVTGTRIQVPSNYTSPNPVTSISGEEMRQLGIVNVADALTTLVPQNLSTYTDFAVSDTRGAVLDGADRGQYFVGNTIANLRGLDPAFGSRTLTLIDGRRTVSTSTQADVVDLNIIPSNLLQRMDVVTGGASATYGSGAMAGVVNLVLNNRLQGFNVDLDYGINEAGDGNSPHVSVSGGTRIGSRGHALLGVEWQKTSAIQNCAEARSWCAESRTLFSNANTPTDPNDYDSPVTGQAPGFNDGGYPARFQMANVRFNQWSENGAILVTGQAGATSGYKFNADGTDVSPYALGFRGGTGGGSVMNGDGPLSTAGTSLRSGNERRTGFANFEFDFTERTTGYLQANYARTEGTNLNTFTTSNSCVRFQTRGQAAEAAVSATPGTVLVLSDPAVQAALASPSFRAWLGNLPSYGGGFNFTLPYWWSGPASPVSITQAPPPPPVYTFGGKAQGNWRLAGGNNEYGGYWWWVLDSITITDPEGYVDPGKPAVLPTVGRDSYAFLDNLSPEALEQLQLAAVFKSSPTSSTSGNSPSTGPGPSYLIGDNPCAGFAAVKKVWSPQFRRSTENDTETMGTTIGLKGRMGADWRWETYYQYGRTENWSVQNNAATSIRQFFAMDAVIDDRMDANGAPLDPTTFGQPICRVKRDGVPLLGSDGRPLSDPTGVQALADACVPLNIFGSSYSDPVEAERQRQAIAYAFVENATEGETSQQTLSFNTSGTLWQGIGAGPFTAAVGIEFRENKLDNSGSQGNYYERFDITGSWSDKFGGTTRLAEGFTELNAPVISGVEGVNLLSFNLGLRYSSINNKGGAGTTRQSLTQHTTNWKFSTVYEPFDWVRARITRSRDMRAAGYRDLFINQPSPGGPDFLSGANPWREWSPDSTEGRQERYGTLTVGNPNLKPEKSDTMTVGLVLSPGGWAQGMRLSADYYDIKVKDGIFVSYALNDPIGVCWRESGNNDPGRNANDDPDPSQPGRNGSFDENNPSCREIQFAEMLDDSGNPIPGSRNLEDIISYNFSRPQNNLPYQRRGVDVALNYVFPLNRMFERVPGSMSFVVRGQRALESSGSESIAFTNDYNSFDLVGQIRSNSFIPGVSPTPKWQGNVTATYMTGGFSSSLRATYVGGAKLDKNWGDSPDDPNYQNENGVFLYGSVDDNFVEAYAIFALSATYDLKVANARQFQIFGSVNNLLDKSPPWSAGYVSGASPSYHDVMGRAYRMGVRMRF